MASPSPPFRVGLSLALPFRAGMEHPYPRLFRQLASGQGMGSHTPLFHQTSLEQPIQGDRRRYTAMTVGWGVIGVGGYADRHLIPAIMQASNGKLVAICHYDKEKAEFFARRNGASRSYTDLAEMTADPEVDVVALCTPV